MKSSAQRDVLPGEEMEATEFRLTEPRAELKRQVAERLAAHRQRRGAGERLESGVGKARTGQRHAAAAAVAERYAQTPSYRSFLAEQAKRAVEEAEAAAEVAQRNAQAVAAVQQELLSELGLWEGEPKRDEPVAMLRGGRVADGLPTAKGVAGGLTVRLYEDLGRQAAGGSAGVRARPAESDAEDLHEVQVLEAEISFRKSPVFEDYKALLDRDPDGDGAPPIPLPANLLEFPRQLVAARKARPRLAEGPLREEGPRTQQLRIFEVEAEQISTRPAAPAHAEWTNIRLDGYAATAPAAAVAGPQMAVVSAAPFATAPVRLRVMAAVVDAGLVGAALVAAVAVFAKLTGELPLAVPGGVALGVCGVVLFLLYELMFFTFSDQTPGMRYARIGLCTFSDDNPSRGAMRRRILAQMVAVCPLGLGLLWSFLDDDGLGWHDRISRMYQRAY